MHLVPGYMEMAAAADIPVQDLYFVDHVASSEVPTWIAAGDIGVIPLPSKPDRFARFTSPLKAFEFQAAGVPLVASDLPSVREVLTHGENAWLVDPDDPGALAAGLARLLADEDLRKSLGARGKLAVAEHTWVRKSGTDLGSFRSRSNHVTRDDDADRRGRLGVFARRSSRSGLRTVRGTTPGGSAWQSVRLTDVAASKPVFVNCRDRVSCLRMFVDWLERAGHERIYLVDNASSFPPLLEYYEATPHVVIRLDENVGHRASRKSGLTQHHAPDTPYVVTDPALDRN